MQTGNNQIETTNLKQGKRIKILDMLNSGMPESEINTAVMSLKEKGNYVDEIDLEKYKLVIESKRKTEQQKQAQEKGFTQNLLDSWGQRAGKVAGAFGIGKTSIDPKLKEELQKRGVTEKINELESMSKGGTLGRGAFSLASNLIGGVFDILGVGISEGIKAMPDFIKEPIKSVGGAMGSGVSYLADQTGTKDVIVNSFKYGFDKIEEFKKDDPLLYEDVSNVGNIALFVPVGMAGKAAKPVVGLVKKTTKKIIGSVDDAIKGVTSVEFKPTLVTTNIARSFDVAKEKTKEITSSAVEKLSKTIGAENYATRIAYNRAEKEMIESVLQRAEKPVRKAYEMGVKMKDANIVAQSTPMELSIGRAMLKNSLDIDLGLKAQSDPRIFVGKEFNNLFQFNKTQADYFGKQIISSIENLKEATPLSGGVSVKEKVFESMSKKLDGLKTIETETGISLDFSDTVLSKNKTAQYSIIKYFDDLDDLNIGNLHKRRQEIFEDMGGKKTAGIQLVGTEEKGLQSIRTSLLNVIDEFAPGYKDLSIQESKILKAIKKLDNKLKQFPDEELADIKLSELSRRLTSNASAEMTGILQELETIARSLGYNSKTSVVQLQEIFNVIERYLDVGKSTSLMGEIKKAVGGMPTGVVDVAKKIGAAGEALGGGRETPATIRRALDDLFGELDKNPLESVIGGNYEVGSVYKNILERENGHLSLGNIGFEGEAGLDIASKLKKKALDNGINPMYGAVAGVETDEEGNIGFSPEKAALGIAGGLALKKGGSLFKEAKKYKSADEFVKAHRITSESIIPQKNKPFEFSYIRNMEKAPKIGKRFGQDIEPAGKYVTIGNPKNIKNIPNMETGNIRFENPLIIDFGGGYNESNNWKNVLSKKYNNKKGKELSNAIQKDGYDGIVTVSETQGEKHTSEIVVLDYKKSQLRQIWEEAKEAKKYKTADEFIKSQGETMYHGTAGKFDMFDDSMKGSVTGAKSAHGATWFTNDPAVAKAYSIYAAESGPINKLIRQHELLEKIAQKSGKNSDWAKVEAVTQKIDDLGDYDATYERRVNASVKEAVAKGDFYKVDAKGKTPQELSTDSDIDSWLNVQVEKAKKLGKDGLIIENIDDAIGLYDKPSTHYAIFDAKNIKTKDQLRQIWEEANSK